MASQEILGDYRRLTAPITGFMEDLCEVIPAATVPCDDLYQAWCTWAADNGHEPGAKPTFASHLTAAEPSIKRERPRTESGTRPYVYRGIKLTEAGLAAAERRKSQMRNE